MSKRLKTAKAQLLIALKEGVSESDFETAFRQAAQSSKGANETWALPVKRHEMAITPHETFMQNSPKRFDAAVQLRGEDDPSELIDRLTEIGRTLAPWLHTEKTAILVGHEVQITTGDGPIFILMPLRRYPHMTRAEFMAHWYERHADLGEAVEGVRYRQNHIDDALSQTVADNLGLTINPLDGMAESYFDSPEAAVALMSRDEVAVGAIEDEERFIDHSRSHFGYYRKLNKE